MLKSFALMAKLAGQKASADSRIVVVPEPREGGKDVHFYD
jgi:hypothetical protein